MYLDLIRIPQTDPPVLEFRWGARAEREVDKEAILNFVCQVGGDFAQNILTGLYLGMA